MNLDEVKFVDLFAGIGGFRLGLERSSKRYKCVWSCDIDRKAATTYWKNFGKMYEWTDIRKASDEYLRSIPDFDLLCAGFPCQAFSVAGKRKGFEDTRGTLFFEICRIARIKRPKILFLENVKGLLSHQRGETFGVILDSLQELGYWVEWQVLNSKHFGVPQNRERVFIIGHPRGSSGQAVFPIRESKPISAENETVGQGTSSCLDAHYARGARKQRQFVAVLSPTIRTPKGGGHLPIVVEDFYKGRPTRFYEDESPVIRRDRQGLKIIDSKKVGDPRIYGKTAPTLQSSDYKEPLKISDGMRIRRLTPVECERLQGFPDNWTRGVSDTQRYKQLGNAVTVPVISFLGRRILERCFL